MYCTLLKMDTIVDAAEDGCSGKLAQRRDRLKHVVSPKYLSRLRHLNQLLLEPKDSNVYKGNIHHIISPSPITYRRLCTTKQPLLNITMCLFTINSRSMFIQHIYKSSSLQASHGVAFHRLITSAIVYRWWSAVFVSAMLHLADR